MQHKILVTFVVLTVFSYLTLLQYSSFDSSPTFTNHNAPVASPNPNSEDVLVMDITLHAPDTDTFLDGDGTSTTGAGSAESINAGDVIKKITLSSGTLCGDTDGTTAPSNIVNDTGSGCAVDVITSIDTSGSVGTHGSLVLDSSGFPVMSYYRATSKDLKVMHCNDVNCAGGDDSIVAVYSADDVGQRS